MNVAKLINLSRFMVQEKISEENFSITYKAKDKKTKQLYSMTICENISDKTKEQIFENINIHSNISHPSINKLIGFSREDLENNYNPVIITEFEPNGTLQNLIDKSKIKQQKFDEPWDFTKKFINIYGIASAMSYLHKNGIIHRSLNTKSVFLDKDYYPKLTNFFFAKNINDLSSNDSIPEQVYDAPEILEGEDYSKDSDVYSFGIILYQIITCLKSSKSSNSIFHTSNKILRGERLEISPNTPPIYSQLIKRCCSSNLYERPSFDEILTLLREDQGYLLQDDSVDQDEIKRYISLVDSSSLSTSNNEYPKQKEVHKRSSVKILPDLNKNQEKNSAIEISSPSQSNAKVGRASSRRLINPDVFNSKEVDLSKIIEQLKAENESLRRENESLKRETSELREENSSLRKQLSQKPISKRSLFF